MVPISPTPPTALSSQDLPSLSLQGPNGYNDYLNTSSNTVEHITTSETHSRTLMLNNNYNVSEESSSSSVVSREHSSSSGTQFDKNRTVTIAVSFIQELRVNQ